MKDIYKASKLKSCQGRNFWVGIVYSCVLTKGSLKKKKTAIIVTSSLSGGRGISQNPIIKLIIIGIYITGGGCPNPEFPTITCWKFVEFSTFQVYNFEFKCPYHSGIGAPL